jgi:hypothetical protein
LILRLTITLFCVVCIIWSGFDDSSGETKWFIYLTNWSFAILTIAFILLTFLSLSKTYQVCRNEPHADSYGTFETSVEAARKQEHIELPPRRERLIIIPEPVSCKWHHQVTWLICNIAFCAAIIVTGAYWLFEAKNVGFLDVVTHAFNTVFVLIELCLGRVPIRLLHFIYTVFYLTLYVIFSVIYWQAGGNNSRGKPYIYKILDYENNNAGVITALVLALVVVAPPLAQLAMLGLHKLRHRCFGHNGFP